MTMRILAGSALLVSVMLCAPLAMNARAAQSDTVAAGKSLATKLCARCHAIAAKGASPNKDAPPFRTIAAKWPVEQLEEAFGEGIVVGHSVMPEFEFQPEQIDALLSYIDSLKK